MRTLFATLTLLALISLAACDNASNGEPSASVQFDADRSRTVQLNVPESFAPAVDAIANPQATTDDLRDRAGSMTEEMRRDADCSSDYSHTTVRPQRFSCA
jgi:hypothetical protein